MMDARDEEMLQSLVLVSKTAEAGAAQYCIVCWDCPTCTKDCCSDCDGTFCNCVDHGCPDGNGSTTEVLETIREWVQEEAHKVYDERHTESLQRMRVST